LTAIASERKRRYCWQLGLKLFYVYIHVYVVKPMGHGSCIMGHELRLWDSYF